MSDQSSVEQVNFNDVTSSIIAKMISEQGADLSVSQLKSLKDTLQMTLSKYNIEEDHNKTELLSI